MTRSSVPLVFVFFALGATSIVSQGTSLLGGNYVATTNVESWANLSLDAREMRASNDYQVKKDIFQNGKNAWKTLDDGTTVLRTLASLSIDSRSEMKDDAIYSFFYHAFLLLGANLEGEDLGNFDTRPVGEYGNTLVNDLFLLNVTHIETEAALIFNVWMWCIHEIYNVLRACERNDDNSQSDMNVALDIAVALWIGAEQPYGSYEEGNMLYNLAEQVGTKFSQDFTEVVANTKILALFSQMQVGIEQGTCKNGTSGYLELRGIMRQLLGHMTVPLVQNLIYHIVTTNPDGKSDFIELYTLAIAPRVEVCNPTVYQELISVLVIGIFNDADETKAINLLQSIYPCLDVSCEQIGEYKGGLVAKCLDDQSLPSQMAGYPATFNVDQYANIDKDIAQIDIMLQLGAQAAAKDYYMYGNNAQIEINNILSLHDLATSDDRNSATSQLSQFATYFGSNDYADEIMMSILDGGTPFVNASSSQYANAGVGTLKYMVLYMASLSKFYKAVEVCIAGGPNATDTSVSLWDQGVAFFIGSIEGSEIGGRDGGQLFFGTNKALCSKFNTCSASHNAEVNEALLTAFAIGSDFLTLDECDEAEAQLEQIIVPGMPATLIQGTLDAAAVTANLLTGTSEGSLALGYAFSSAILPLVDAVNPSDAATIRSNMEFQLTSQPVPDGAAAVFDAFREAIVSMATDCRQIGVYQDGYFGGLCPNDDVANTASPTIALAPTAAPYGSPVTFPPTVLGFGRYTFSSNISRIADIALDVRDMLQAENVTMANNTYVNGKNAKFNSTTVSLAQLSRTAATYMHQDPMFNIFRWALVDEEVFSKVGNETSLALESAFADIVVGKALSIANDTKLAAETTVVMNVWMEITHDLYNSVRECEKSFGGAPMSIDRAVALWLGEEQTYGSFTTGYLMYHITQKAAQNWGGNTTEAAINGRLFNLFSAAKVAATKCVRSPDAVKALRSNVAAILVLMTVPLLQNLLFYLDLGNDNYIELYALAVIPQAVGCGESNFLFLRDILVNEAQFNRNTLDSMFFESMKGFQRCLRISCDDLLDGTNPSLSLRTLVLNQCHNPSDSVRKNLAGFETTTLSSTEVGEMARLDLDILQIGIFMETKAYDAAMDYYMNGYNSYMTSLHKIATSPSRTIVSNQYDLFSNYFMSTNYTDDIMLQALTQLAPFSSASDGQLAAATVRILQTMVSYMAILEKFYLAVQICRGASGPDMLSVTTWETGVALYVGSIEGHARGGDSLRDGTLLYGLAKDLCGFFGTCEGSGDASVNEFLIDAFGDGRDLLVDKDCDGADGIIRDAILGSLPVPLIQGTLFEAYVLDEQVVGTEVPDLASGYIFALSVIPLIMNKTIATTIKTNMAFDLNVLPVRDGVDKVFDAFAFVVDEMKVDCQDISAFVNTTICSITTVPGDPGFRPPPATSTTLGGGMYKTTTYVQDRANIALDIDEIKKALDENFPDRAQKLYMEGSNSEIYDNDGKRVGFRSFAKFSTQETANMTAEPYFNLFTYALQDTAGKYQGKELRFYADTIITEIFESNSEATRMMAIEGILVLNLWMALVHELEQTLSNCKKQLIADADGIHSIDEAVAYWIGDGQVFGNGTKGHLLYALSERMGEIFGIDENGQSRTNTNILRLFNQARLELSFPSACSESPNTYPRLRQIVRRIISQMTIPLLQSLIHNLRENDRNRVKLYAQAFAPLVVACSPTLYSFLQDKLINLTYNVIEVETIIAKIRISYDCLGITCDDVGVHPSEKGNFCVNTPKLNSLAGYRPSNDVRSYALVDLDILECSILLTQQAFTACEDIYMLGKHAVVNGDNGEETLSLSYLATTSERTVVPQYELFVQYFGSDSKYADTLVKRALSNDFPGASVAQRKEMAVKSMQYLVLYMSILQFMYEALVDCNSGDALKIVTASQSWDRAAAILIGSVEGTNDGGTGDGQSFYALEKSSCVHSGTCGNSNASDVNVQIISLLYTGHGEVQAGSCNALKRTVDKIEPLLLVPLLQSVLFYALENEKLPAGSPDGKLANGYIFSLSVLPLVDDSNRASGGIIETNLGFQLDSKPVPDGAIAVFNAFATIYATVGVDCKMIGDVNGVSACNGSSETNSGGGNSRSGLIVGVTVGVIALFAIGAFIFIKRPFHRSSKSDDVPIFIQNNNGELNHNDDLLTGNFNDASVAMSDEVFDKEVAEQAPIV